MSPPAVIGSWWSFAQADRGVVGLAVVVVIATAGGYLGRRWWRARRGE